MKAETRRGPRPVASTSRRGRRLRGNKKTRFQRNTAARGEPDERVRTRVTALRRLSADRVAIEVSMIPEAATILIDSASTPVFAEFIARTLMELVRIHAQAVVDEMKRRQRDWTVKG